MKPLKVAVTGVAGASGQSIMKALAAAQVYDHDRNRVPINVYPVDVQPFSAGLYRGQGGTVLPKPEEDIDAWCQWTLENEIDVLFPGADRDLPPLAAVRDAWTHTKVIVGDASLIETANDKGFTAQQLFNHGIPGPKTMVPFGSTQLEMLLCDWEGFPVVIKPRSDAASRGVHVCYDRPEMAFYARRTESVMIQEYLDGPEYTCGIIRDTDGNVAICMAERKLYAGSTYLAEVAWWPELMPILRQIADGLKPYGPLNVQLRLTKDGPKVFELNARMSGSTAIRAQAGFNEPEMLLNHFVYGRPIAQPQYRNLYAMRYWDEVILEGVDGEMIASFKGRVPVKGKIPSWL